MYKRGGYLITANQNSGRHMKIGTAFLKTDKKLPQNGIISGNTVYIGQKKYTDTRGLKNSIAEIKVYKKQRVSVKLIGGDPFSPDYY